MPPTMPEKKNCYQQASSDWPEWGKPTVLAHVEKLLSQKRILREPSVHTALSITRLDRIGKRLLQHLVNLVHKHKRFEKHADIPTWLSRVPHKRVLYIDTQFILVDDLILAVPRGGLD